MANNYDTTTKFKVDISELKSAMQEAKRSIALANSEFKSASSGMDNWSKSSDGLTAKLKQLNSNLGNQKTVLTQYEKTLEEVKKEYGENSKEAQEWQIKVNNQQAVVNKTEQAIAKFETQLTNVTKAEEISAKTGKDVDTVLEEMTKGANSAEGGIAKLEGGFTVLKGAMASLVADGIRKVVEGLKEIATASVSIGMDFEQSMSQVQAISGASADELSQLEATAREFGATTVFSASESAQALKYMALAGWDAQQSSDALGGVLNLASAGAMDLASASDMVTDYMSAFNMEAKKAGYMADILAYAQGNANTSVEQLGQAFQNASANMSASGQDIETTTALISAMSNQGLKGSRAGTALSAMMRDLTAKMKDGKIAIGDTLVEVQDAEGNFRDLTDILKDVETATNGMGTAQKATALQSTFTADSIKGINLVLNEGVDSIASFEEELRNSSGTAEDMATTMNDNVAGKIKTFKSALEEIALKIYENLEPALSDVMTFVQDLADSFNEWLADPANKKAIDDLAKSLKDFVKNSLTSIKDFVKFFINNKDGIIAGITAIGAGLVAWNVANMINGVVKSVKAFQLANEGATVAQALLNGVMKANPIMLIATLLTTLIAGLVTFIATNDEAKAKLIEVWNAIKEGVGTAIEGLVTFFTVTIPNALQSVIEWVKSNWTTLVTFLINPFAGLFKYFYENNAKFKEFVDNAINAIKELPVKVWTWLLNTISKVKDWFTQMIQKAKDTGSQFVSNIIEFISQLPSKIWTWLSNAISKVTNFVSDLKSKALEAGRGFVTNIINAVSGLPEQFKSIGSNIVEGIWSGITNGWGNLVENIKGLAKGLLESAKEALKVNSPSKVFRDVIGKAIPEGIGVGIKKYSSYATNAVNTMADGIVTTGDNAINGNSSVNGVGGVVNNFNQYNYSPEPLNRLEIYRQSKNLLGFAGGV